LSSSLWFCFPGIGFDKGKKFVVIAGFILGRTIYPRRCDKVGSAGLKMSSI
jgi:hypothetical protein